MAKRSLTLIVPGSLETRTGGYIYDRRMMAALRTRGWQIGVQELAGGFPRPSSAARAEAARVLAGVPDAATVLFDGLALGALPSEVEQEGTRLRLIALVHHPLAEERGTDARTAAELRTTERRALAAVRQVIVTSRATARALAADYGVAHEQITVVEPGTDAAPLASGSTDGVVHMLSVAAIVPRKGHDILIRALKGMTDVDGWRLECVGSLERDEVAVERLRAQVAAEGLQDRVRLRGEVDEEGMDAEYDAADLFVLPTFHEGYGMAVAEALARGLPVISTQTGAIGDLVENGAGLLVPPGDVESLRAALMRVVGDRSFRQQLAEGARRVRERLPTWDEAASKMAEALA